MSKNRELFFVQDENGRVWDDTVAFSEKSCQVKFANLWNGRVQIDSHTAWVLWKCYEKSGWRISSVRVSGFPNPIEKPEASEASQE